MANVVYMMYVDLIYSSTPHTPYIYITLHAALYTILIHILSYTIYYTGPRTISSYPTRRYRTTLSYTAARASASSLGIRDSSY